MFQFNVLLNQLRSFYLDESVLKEDFDKKCLLLESSLFVIVLFSFKIVKMRKVRMCWPGQTLNSVNFDTEIVTICYYSSIQLEVSQSLTTTENVFHQKPARRENNFDSSPSVSTY